MAASLVLGSGRPVAQAGPPPAPVEVAAFITAELQRQGVPGAAIALARGERVLWQQGFGVASIETGTSITPATLFQIGSLTKLFTATAIVRASRERGLDLDAPVSRYVSGLAPCVGAATLGELLSHQGGLKDEPDEYGPHDESALLEYARTWTDGYCLLPRGTVYSYSNSGFALAGLALQEAVHEPYARLMDSLVFEPVGMRRTTFRPTMAMTYPIALGHRAAPAAGPAVVRPAADDARLWPAGEMWTNVEDLGRFAVAFLNDGRLDGSQVLPPGLAAVLATPRADVATQDERYGYGLNVDRRRGYERVGHDGTMPGFVATLQMVPRERLALAVLTNLETTRLEPLVDGILGAVLPASSPITDAPPGRAALPRQADRYLGKYTNPQRWTLEVTRNDRQLVLKQFGREFPLEMIDERRFRFTMPGRDRPEIVVFGPVEERGVAYVQFFVWAFARVREGEAPGG